MSETSRSLVLLPGLLCDHDVWYPVVQQIGTPASACHIPDYGDADTIAAMAEIALVGAPSRFTLVGHSMGGRVALEIYRMAPERVESLVLADTGFAPRAQGDAGEQEKAKRFALLEHAREYGMRSVGKRWLNGMIHPDRKDDTALVESILAMIERKTPDLFAAQIHALLNRPDATGLLSEIACPTRLLCGRQDSWSPLSRHEEMAERIAESELHVIEEAGHMSPMERPDAFARAMTGVAA